MVAVLLASAAYLLAVPSLASAGTFTAFTCHEAAGNAVGTRGWSVGTPSAEYITFGDSCASGGEGSFGLSMGPDPIGEYSNGNGDTMTYSVPAGLSILSYSLQLEAFGGPCAVVNEQCTDGMGQVWVNHTGQGDPNYDYRNLGYGAQETTVSARELSGVDTVSVNVSCDAGQDLNYKCPGSTSVGPESRALVSGGSFALLDSTVPSVTNVSGSLIAGGTLTGTDAIDFTASDSGGGVYSAAALIDGQQVAWEVPNTNGGLCVNLAPASSTTMAFAAPQPCPLSENVSLSVNTSQISAGQHRLQVLVTDAAGDQATAYDGTITVAGPPSTPNAPGGTAATEPCSPTALRSTLGTANASGQAKLTARWASTEKALRTSRYGAADRITGRLMSSAGAGMAGAEIDVCETPAYDGAPTRSIGEVRTGATGQWTLSLPGDASSAVLRFVYPDPQDDTIPLATAALTLHVHAGIELRIAPHVTSVGHTIHFTGTLLGGPIPPGGKQLVLEASSGGEWIEFRTVTTNAKGRYRASYRFKFPGPVTYRFRAVSPDEADFPYLGGASNVVDVHER